jgi:hypothetical protein
MKREGEISVFAGDGVMHGDEFGAVRKCSFDLDFRDHFGNAGHDLIAPEKFAAEFHQFGHGAAVANEFEELRGDECDAFGVVQAQAAREALLREEAGVVKKQFINVARSKMHRLPFTKPWIVVEEARNKGERVVKSLADLFDGISRDAKERAFGQRTCGNEQ